jgi:hypothetical protein
MCMAEDNAMSVSVENRRNRSRSAVAAILTVLLLAPVGILFLQVWNSTSDDRDMARNERRGVAYLTRLGPLLTALAEAQAAALQGSTAAPASLTAAVAGVAEADSRLGDALGTTDRWNGLRDKIGELPGVTGGTLPVLQANVEASDLLVALYSTVLDNSQLARDPVNDVSHLQVAVGLDLPTAVVQGARAADLSVLVANASATEKAQLGPQLGTTLATVDVAVGKLTDNLQAASTDTGSGTLSSNLLGTVDGFRGSVEALVRGATAPGKPDIAGLTSARVAMQQAVTGLSNTILTEMDGLLRTRTDNVETDRRRAQITAGAAVLIALLALVVPLLGRRRSAAPDRSDGAPAGRAGEGTSGDEPFGPEPYGNEVPATRRERSGALR